MIETMYIMQNENAAITRRHRVNDLVDGKAVNNARLRQVACTEAPTGAFIRGVRHKVVERDRIERPFSQVHQNDVDGCPVQPCAEY